MFFFSKEIYSTYLVDSIRPHYSARKLVSSKSNDPLLQQLSQPAILESPSDLGAYNNLIYRTPSEKKLGIDYIIDDLDEI